MSSPQLWFLINVIAVLWNIHTDMPWIAAFNLSAALLVLVAYWHHWEK